MAHGAGSVPLGDYYALPFTGQLRSSSAVPCTSERSTEQVPLTWELADGGGDADRGDVEPQERVHDGNDDQTKAGQNHIADSDIHS
eukprot:3069045-Rhodomonas_salina.3